MKYIIIQLKKPYKTIIQHEDKKDNIQEKYKIIIKIKLYKKFKKI